MTERCGCEAKSLRFRNRTVVSVRAIKGRYEEEPRLIVRVREMETHELAEIHEWMWEGEQ